jgi:hypothetical protein
MSELLDIRVIGAPEVAEQAVTRLAVLLAVDRCTGPYPSRKIPGLVRFYLSGRLLPTHAAAAKPAHAPAADAPADLEV